MNREQCFQKAYQIKGEEKMKKKICVVILILIALGLLFALLKSCDRSYEPTGSVEKGYSYLAKGKTERAQDEFEEYIYNFSENDYSDPDIVKELMKAYTGLIEIQNAMGEDLYLGADIIMLFKEIHDEDINIEHSIDELKELARWYLVEYCDEKDISHYTTEFTHHVPELKEYIRMGEVDYDKTEPYNLFVELYVDGNPTGRKIYTGKAATVKWVIEGYEEKEPYKEFERKYIEGNSTDEIRYTGKTKPKDTPKAKSYPYPNCPYCKYSASADPNNHPGHGLDGLLGFERGQNSDGSWGFYYVYGESDYGV